MRYLFVDGGFLESMVATTAKNFGLSDLAIRFDRLALDYDRVFYYDAYPVKKPNQSDEEFEIVRSNKEAYFRRIDLTPNMHTRTGITRFRARARNTEQKGVDILLALDAYKAAIRADVEHVHVLACDVDFFPLLESLRETRAKTYLHCFPRDTSVDLQYLADQVIPFNPFSVLKYCGLTWEQYFEFSYYDPVAPRFVVKEGSMAGMPAIIYTDEEGRSDSYYIYAAGCSGNGKFRCSSIENCIWYVEAQYQQLFVPA